MLLKKYSDFGGGKKKSDSEFLSYNLMLNRDKRNKYSNSERNTKPNPPLQVKWSVPNTTQNEIF